MKTLSHKVTMIKNCGAKLYTHEKTGEAVYKESKRGAVVSILYVLDKDLNEIPDGTDPWGKPSFKIVVCQNKYLKVF